MTMHHTPRSAEEQAKLDAAIVDLWERQIAFNQVLGLKVAQLYADPGTSATFVMRPDLIGSKAHNRLHGGVTAAVLDAVAGMALMVAQSTKHPHESAEQVMHRFLKMGTIDMRIDYLRPGVGHTFTGWAEVTRLGSRVGSTTMRLTNEKGTLIATGAGAYMIS